MKHIHHLSTQYTEIDVEGVIKRGLFKYAGLNKVFNTDLVRPYNIFIILIAGGVTDRSLGLNPQGSGCTLSLLALSVILDLEGREEVRTMFGRGLRSYFIIESNNGCIVLDVKYRRELGG